MRFCPECRSEYRPGFDRCGDCGIPLVESLPEPPPLPAPLGKLRQIHTTTSLPEALSLQALLEGQGIDCLLENEHSGIMTLGLATPAVPFILSVPDTQAAEALELLLQARTPEPAPNLLQETGVPSGSGAPENDASAGRMNRQSARTRLGWTAAAVLFFISLPLHEIPGAKLSPIAVFGAWLFLLWAVLSALRSRLQVPEATDRALCLFMLAGALGGIPMAFLEKLLFTLAGVDTGNVAAQFFIVGPVEEIGKLAAALVAFRLALPRGASPRAIILGCAASGAGFGLLENAIVGVMAEPHEVAPYILLRSVALLHVGWSALVGLSLLRKTSAPSLRWVTVPVGLLGASLLHGGWNALAVEEQIPGLLVSFTIQALIFFASVRAAKEGIPSP